MAQEKNELACSVRHVHLWPPANSAEWKEEFGQALVFQGGIDLQRALTGTLAETIRETKRRIADYAPGGGDIAGPSNHFTSDVPVENFFALYRTARESGTCPLPRESAA
jgi:uroporphyrinogen decarboxylase